MSAVVIRVLAAIAGTVPIVYIGVTLVLGAQWDGYDPIRDTQSELGAVDAPMGWVMNASFAVLGASMLAFAAVFGATFRASPRWVVPALAALAGAGMIAVAFAPCDAGCVDVTDTGRLHGLLSMPGAIALPVAAAMAARPIALDGRLGAGWPLASFVIGVVSLAAGPVTALDLVPDAAGLVQRVGMWSALAWMSALAWRALRLHPPTERRRAAARAELAT